MQIYGIDEEKLILASDAIKQKNYLCPECFQLIRVKNGLHRRNHFFHLTANRSCNQHRKDLTHLAVQRAIITKLPQGETSQEHPFVEIHRIADVAWIPKKLIFEIQCSPITLQELKARNRDYESLGYTVIWILHQKTFNRRKLSATENYLKDKTFYYTSINSQGAGTIYDQFNIIHNGIRMYKSFPIDIRIDFPQKSSIKTPLPKALLGKSYTFQNDLISRIRERSEYAQWMLDLESRYEKKRQKHSLLEMLNQAHKTLLYILLRTISR